MFGIPRRSLHTVLAIVLAAFIPPAFCSALIPGHYAGTLPCADCPGIETHLDIAADGTYVLREYYIDRSTKSNDDIGRWLLSTDNQVLALYGQQNPPLFFSIDNKHQTLERRDMARQPILSSLNYRLQRQAPSTPPVLHLQLNGLLHLTDGQPARFTECVTGTVFPVAETGAYTTVIATYLKTRHRENTAQPSVIRIRGRIEPDSMLVIQQFNGFYPLPDCPATITNRPLTGSQWTLIQENADSTTSSAYLTFSTAGELKGHTDCGQITARYLTEQNTMNISMIEQTHTICSDPQAADNTLLKILEAVHTWRITGTFLDFYNAAGQHIGQFETVKPQVSPLSGTIRPNQTTP